MATYETLKLTAAGDLDFSNGTIQTVEDGDAVGSQLRVDFNLCKGDYFLNLLEGIDYFGEVFGKKKIDNQLIDEFKLTAINATGIKALKEFTVELPTDRGLTVDIKAHTEFSDIDETIQIEIA
ncbi:MAG: hypothetical protein HOD85_12745 [Deltaproteobacteria bacterium]|jgi:hypothetical protein|nr:hypothetical protein [Deltaproteobacteria bacterium]